jgi:hypothetical protein
MALRPTHPLTEMSTRNLPGGKGWPARKADNLTVICEPTIKRKYGNLDASRPYGSSQPVTGIPLPFFTLYGRKWISKKPVVKSHVVSFFIFKTLVMTSVDWTENEENSSPACVIFFAGLISACWSVERWCIDQRLAWSRFSRLGTRQKLILFCRLSWANTGKFRSHMITYIDRYGVI